MEKRKFKRILVNMAVKFYSCDMNYTGTVSDLSEKGMLISVKEIHFPFTLRFTIVIPLDEKVLHLPATLSRITTSPDFRDAIGVKLLDPGGDYLGFIDSLKSVYKI